MTLLRKRGASIENESVPETGRPARPAPALADHYARLERDLEVYRQNIILDKDRLDEAASDQPRIYMEVGENCAMAESHLALAKKALAQKDSEIARSYRLQCERDKTKFTNDSVNDHVLLHNEHLSLRSDVDRWERLHDLWAVLKSAYEQRMRMIRELVALYCTGYYTSGSMDAPSRAMRDKQAEAGRLALNESRKARGGYARRPD